jgi:hypothetical protein
LSCTAVGQGPTNNSLPGTYSSVNETGTYSGSGFTPTNGSWSAFNYVVPTPTPSPSPLPSFSPAPTPTGTFTPAPTPTPVTYYYWLGTYSVSSFTTTNLASPGPLAVAATTGCFVMFATGTTGTNNGFGTGNPTFATPYSINTNIIGSGSITSFTISPPLAANNGPFMVSFGLSSGGTGTATINQFQTFTFSDARQAAAFIQQLKQRAGPAP